MAFDEDIEVLSLQNDNSKEHVLMEKGNKISDMSPLMEMKNSVANLKIEIQEMEVRIGVLEHTLLKNQLNQGLMTIAKSGSDVTA
ncbi:hypothetical protein KP509_35G004300 [Ceratopteris richardii]|uniref:Uncharacterized protein n=1 Tax=Ceratopteris richardii TaxID=49495 RepID=A0A8T2QES0_CERRI|nr:hypothetical protein KP509_35G004300 [Ceratopteris richardii]